MAIQFQTATKEVQVLRSFAGMEAYEEGKRLRVVFTETTLVDGEILKQENKSYDRDYDFWKASQIGQAIIGMIELDLMQEDPAAPRPETSEEPEASEE
jgi:hypothetical protein